jgi:hypothetical protein
MAPSPDTGTNVVAGDERYVQYMESSLMESWYPERQSLEDLLVSCALMGAPTAHSNWDRSAPDNSSLL